MTNDDLRALVQRLRKETGPEYATNELSKYHADLMDAAADELESLLARAEAAERLYLSCEDDCARLRQDAVRYRWLRAEHDRVDPIARTVWKLHHDRRGSEWCDIAGPLELDAAIDRAIAEGKHET